MITLSEFRIRRGTKDECHQLLMDHHYLSTRSKGFKSGFNVVMEDPNGEIAGVCIFTGFPVPELAAGLFGLDRDDQDGLWELSRLCLLPAYQGVVANLASYFVSRSIRLLRSSEVVRAILSYADMDFHTGTVYQACNFAYYGVTAAKSDFWVLTEDGYQKHSRGPVRGLTGEWRPRSRKHRYLIVYDDRLTPRWEKQPYPKAEATLA